MCIVYACIFLEHVIRKYEIDTFQMKKFKEELMHDKYYFSIKIANCMKSILITRIFKRRNWDFKEFLINKSTKEQKLCEIFTQFE
jgi:hypothetical protein